MLADLRLVEKPQAVEPGDAGDTGVAVLGQRGHVAELTVLDHDDPVERMVQRGAQFDGRADR